MDLSAMIFFSAICIRFPVYSVEFLLHWFSRSVSSYILPEMLSLGIPFSSYVTYDLLYGWSIILLRYSFLASKIFINVLSY